MIHQQLVSHTDLLAISCSDRDMIDRPCDLARQDDSDRLNTLDSNSHQVYASPIS